MSNVRPIQKAKPLPPRGVSDVSGAKKFARKKKVALATEDEVVEAGATSVSNSSSGAGAAAAGSGAALIPVTPPVQRRRASVSVRDTIPDSIGDVVTMPTGHLGGPSRGTFDVKKIRNDTMTRVMGRHHSVDSAPTRAPAASTAIHNTPSDLPTTSIRRASVSARSMIDPTLVPKKPSSPPRDGAPRSGYNTAPTGNFKGVNVKEIRTSMDLAADAAKKQRKASSALKRRVSIDEESDVETDSDSQASEEVLQPRGHRPTRSEIVNSVVNMSVHAHSDVVGGSQSGSEAAMSPTIPKRSLGGGSGGGDNGGNDTTSFPRSPSHGSLLNQKNGFGSPPTKSPNLSVPCSPNNSSRSVTKVMPVSVRNLRADTIESSEMKKMLHNLALKESAAAQAQEVTGPVALPRGVEVDHMRGSLVVINGSVAGGNSPHRPPSSSGGTISAATTTDRPGSKSGSRPGSRPGSRQMVRPEGAPQEQQATKPSLTPLLFLHVSTLKSAFSKPPSMIQIELLPRTSNKKVVKSCLPLSPGVYHTFLKFDVPSSKTSVCISVHTESTVTATCTMPLSSFTSTPTLTATTLKLSSPTTSKPNCTLQLRSRYVTVCERDSVDCRKSVQRFMKSVGEERKRYGGDGYGDGGKSAMVSSGGGGGSGGSGGGASSAVISSRSHSGSGGGGGGNINKKNLRVEAVDDVPVYKGLNNVPLTPNNKQSPSKSTANKQQQRQQQQPQAESPKMDEQILTLLSSTTNQTNATFKALSSTAELLAKTVAALNNGSNNNNNHGSNGGNGSATPERARSWSTPEKSRSSPGGEQISSALKRKRSNNSVLAWTPLDVTTWLSSPNIMLPQYTDAFRYNAIDGLTLVSLTNELLVDIGVNVSLHRNKIMLHVAKMRASNKEELGVIEREVQCISDRTGDVGPHHHHNPKAYARESSGGGSSGNNSGANSKSPLRGNPTERRRRSSDTEGSVGARRSRDNSLDEGDHSYSSPSRKNKGSVGTKNVGLGVAVATKGNDYNNLLNKPRRSSVSDPSRHHPGDSIRQGSRHHSTDGIIDNYKANSSRRESTETAGSFSPSGLSPSLSLKSISSMGDEPAEPLVLGTRSQFGQVEYEFDDEDDRPNMINEVKDDPADLKMYNNMLSDIWKDI
jgi:hypothetical protein